MVSGIIGFVSVVSLDPIKVLRDDDPLFVGYLVPTGLDDSLADIHCRVNRLGCHDYVILLQPSQQLVKKMVHND